MRTLGIRREQVALARVVKRSVDARHQTPRVLLTVEIFVDGEQKPAEIHFDYPDVNGKTEVVIVGGGPAGLFAALRMIELGLKPILLERGRNVADRRRDIAQIHRGTKVDGESNYAFGEGGAGTFSDGKLFTRSKKRGDYNRALQTLVFHGASPEILYEAHPHIGTDRLPKIIEQVRQTIIGAGGEIHFERKVTDIEIRHGRAVGVWANGELIEGAAVVLATGHSADDIYEMLHRKGVRLEAKAWAMGVRVEHPQELIDRIQYHSPNGRGKYLLAAEYSFTTQVDGRGVYSFCMCPGGVVVPSASAAGELLVNGMSPSHRGGKWSNSGMVVQINPEDVLHPDMKIDCEDILPVPDDSPLRVMNFQEQLEHICWVMGNRKQTAPAQRMTDFVRGKLSYDLPHSSYAPGLISSPLHFWMPRFVSSRLQRGFEQFGRMSRGFLTSDATMIGVETRTSSPVRIVRDNDTLQHVTIEGLFPCGEGAGYAGGIVSAAVDGERCAMAAKEYVMNV